MPLPTGSVIGILADNLRQRKSVLPISAKNATRWTDGLGLRRGGETVLYTGMMYQLIPYIEGLVKAEQKLGDSPLAKFTGLGRRMNRMVNLSAFMARPSAEEKTAYDQIPINVAVLLRKAGVDFGALYEDDLYTGALAYDLGADEAVIEHARHVQSVLRTHGVKRVITIDPHTTNMLRSVYPKLLKDFDVEVQSYLEVLAEKGLVPSAQLNGTVAIHDSCVFARSEGVLQQPRDLLGKAGIEMAEPENTGRFTWCCGGPVESLYPEKAAANAAKRVEQLRAAVPDGATPECVTMCPMCYVNLAGAAGATMRFKDISHYLREAYAS
jgi:Fe-S oxidoreductase